MKVKWRGRNSRRRMPSETFFLFFFPPLKPEHRDKIAAQFYNAILVCPWFNQRQLRSGALKDFRNLYRGCSSLSYDSASARFKSKPVNVWYVRFENDDASTSKWQVRKRTNIGRGGKYLSLFHVNFVVQKEARGSMQEPRYLEKNESREKLYIDAPR